MFVYGVCNGGIAVFSRFYRHRRMRSGDFDSFLQSDYIGTRHRPIKRNDKPRCALCIGADNGGNVGIDIQARTDSKVERNFTQRIAFYVDGAGKQYVHFI